MDLIELGAKYSRPVAVALGFFDCMHKGHVRLLDEVKKLSKAQGCASAMFTFDNSHFSLLGKNDKIIYTYEERLSVMENLGVETVIFASFDKQLMETSGKAFLEKLCETEVAAVVCGFDYTCGRDRLCAVDVKSFCEARGIVCSIVPAVYDDNGEKIGSTLVRKLIGSHNIEQANSLLTENFFILGEVTHGRHVGGTTLGFPTANLLCSPDKLLPVGVFSAVTVIDDKKYAAVVNIGAKPTFGIDAPSVEAHIIGFDGDLYGKTLKLSLKSFLRETKKFSSAEELCKQLSKDKARATL